MFRSMLVVGLMTGLASVQAEEPGAKKVSEAPPVVVKTVPAAGSDNVDPATKEIQVTFSKEMKDRSWSWGTEPEFGTELPGDAVSYDKTLKVCTMTVKLKPETTYATWINSNKYTNFKDAGGTPAVPYLLVFRTGKAKAQ